MYVYAYSVRCAYLQWCQWHIYNAKVQVGYTMAVKTEELRKKWIDAIKLAL